MSSEDRFRGRRAILVTQHGKEQAIGPALAELGVDLEVLAIDTDRFGTFTGEVERAGGPLDAARAKIAAGSALRPGDLVVASEGSFGPHPRLLLRAADHELVLLVDTRDGLELVGEHVTFDTNHGAHVVRSVDEVERAARALGLPTHAAVVRAHGRVTKGIFGTEALVAAVRRALDDAREVTIEADLRAMCNPSRMRAIAAAAHSMVQAARTPCPRCSTPGFVVRDVRRGLPCEDCGTPTRTVAADVLSCQACHHRRERPRGANQVAARWCDVCNP